jgi:hypothetical protein
MADVAHLGRHAHLLGHAGHQPGLPDVVGQRLLAIDVLALAHGRHGDIGMREIGRGADHRVDLRHLRQHDAEILIVGTVEVRLLLPVVGLDLALQRQTPHAHLVEEVVLVVGRRIGHGDDPHVR